MPNVTLQYTANLADQFVPAQLLGHLHHAFAATGQFEMNDVKGRAIRLDEFQIGLNETPDKAFVHVIVATMRTRSEALKKQPGQALLQELQATFRPKFDATACPLRVEIIPIDPAFYLAG